MLDHRGATYRVDTLDLATGERYPTIDENKDVVGDMAGQRVKGVLSADGQLLATLYQTPGAPEPGAFVHVLAPRRLDLLRRPAVGVRDGPDGSVVIERHGDDVVVISEHAEPARDVLLQDLVDCGSSSGLRCGDARARASARTRPTARSRGSGRSSRSARRLHLLQHRGHLLVHEVDRLQRADHHPELDDASRRRCSG